MRKLWQQAQINTLLTSLTSLLMVGVVNVLDAKTIAPHTSLPGSSSSSSSLLTNQKPLAITTRRTTAYEEFTNAITVLNTFNKFNHPTERKADAIIHQKAQSRHKPHVQQQKRGEINDVVNNISRELNKTSSNELFNWNNNTNNDNKNNNNSNSVNEHNNEVDHSDASNRLRRSVFHVRWNPNEKFVVESREKPAVNHSKLSPHPRWALSKNTKLTLNPKLYVCHDHFSDRCHNKTAAFRQYIVDTFDKSVSEAANETNFYHVDFKPLFGDSFEEQYYPSACLVMEAGLRVLKRRDAPFNRLEFGKLFPKQKLFRHLKSVKTCAIVSSAGSLAGSKMGRFIDSHDIVMRFNDAPTRGYEVDVGSKTTIRVLNSQVVTKDEFDFTHAPIFQNITIAAWDPGKYNGTLGDWLTSADYDLFTNYEIYRRRYPKSRAFLVHPHSVWRLWQSLQMFAGNRPIRKNPPSSGFIGLALLLPHCPYVDFIEYMPSTRLNGRCHYYSKEMNSACTFGAWHPLAAEKLMALDMNIADDMSVFQFGLLRIRRPDKLLCGFNFLGY